MLNVRAVSIETENNGYGKMNVVENKENVKIRMGNSRNVP